MKSTRFFQMSVILTSLFFSNVSEVHAKNNNRIISTDRYVNKVDSAIKITKANKNKSSKKEIRGYYGEGVCLAYFENFSERGSRYTLMGFI